MLVTPKHIGALLPKGWPSRVRSAVVHAISMSNVVFTVTRCSAPAILSVFPSAPETLAHDDYPTPTRVSGRARRQSCWPWPTRAAAGTRSRSPRCGR